MKITKEKYLNSNKANQLDMLWFILEEMKSRNDLVLLFVFVFMAWIKWG